MFRTTIALRWSDLDAEGHVNNAVIADYLQEARTAFFRAGPCSGLLDSGVVVVGHRISYLAPITYSDAGIGAEVAITRLGGARFDVAYALFQDATPVARARTVLCPFDFETQQPTRLALTAREWLAEHRAEVEPMRHIDVPDLGRNGSVTPCPVRWSDLDSYGHVNNVKVLDYLMQARIAATTSWSPAMVRSGTRKAPLRTAPAALGHPSVTLAAEIFNPDDGTTFARGRTILVAADGEGKPVALPEEVRKDLTKRLID